jgi:hypothetical protein
MGGRNRLRGTNRKSDRAAADDLVPFLERFIRGLSPEWAEKARRFRAVADVPIEELGAHPDLGERLQESVRNLPDVEFGVYYRMFAARTPAGQVFALAQGTGTIRFRVGGDSVAGVCREGVAPDGEFGKDWVKVDAWNSEVPTGQWMKTLRELAAIAYAFSASGD